MMGSLAALALVDDKMDANEGFEEMRVLSRGSIIKIVIIDDCRS